ncbi:hypothetical protein WR25_01303 [Diploscapter pachys]|uniref:Uncharacterized protein n=1 Tax=Diploscapter pachys TaxID=2018661 RepID=A0A2A2M437_9BILA|nr:hypothetical protein WR25_01303 [Diploscapter pachys]
MATTTAGASSAAGPRPRPNPRGAGRSIARASRRSARLPPRVAVSPLPRSPGGPSCGWTASGSPTSPMPRPDQLQPPCQLVAASGLSC